MDIPGIYLYLDLLKWLRDNECSYDDEYVRIGYPKVLKEC